MDVLCPTYFTASPISYKHAHIQIVQLSVFAFLDFAKKL